MRAFISFLILANVLSLASPVRAIGQDKVFRALIDTDGVQRVTMLAGEYFFDPNYIIVKVNVPVEIEIRKKAGMVPHNFTLEAPEGGIKVSEDLSSTPKIIRFTPMMSGKYAFYCNKKLLFFESHRDKGMGGVLEVRP